MTLLDYRQIAQYEGFCYEDIVTDLELYDEFKSVTGKSIENYEYSPTKMSEDELIHRIIDASDEEYILYSDVVGMNERMYYAILKIK
jgi:hypothetical protein